jgi:hypothetical protein
VDESYIFWNVLPLTMMIPPLVDFIAFLVMVFAAGFFFDTVFLLAMADLL